MRLVIYPPVDEKRLRAIEETGDFEVVNATDESQAQAGMPEADAFFGKLTPQLLAASTKLRWVQSPTASLEHFIFDELVDHPCVLTNMRGLFYDVIADHVFSYILCFARNIPLYLRQQQQGLWAPVGGEAERTTFASGPSHASAIDRAHLHLSDCTLGVVGLGSIGGEVARRGAAFGMRVLAVDPVRTTKPDDVESLWPADRLGELLSESDFVAICAPHTPQTEKLFRTPQFEQMKSGAYLINIGRGVIVDLDDLCRALDSGQIAGAALDVFEIEPLPPDHPLWRNENVILTPHVAAASPRIAERHLATLLENVRRFCVGEELLNVVDKRQWF